MAAEQTTWQRDWTVVPGEILIEALEERGMSQSELARRMGIKQNYLYRVLPGLQSDGKVRKDGRGWHPKG